MRNKPCAGVSIPVLIDALGLIRKTITVSNNYLEHCYLTSLDLNSPNFRPLASSDLTVSVTAVNLLVASMVGRSLFPLTFSRRGMKFVSSWFSSFCFVFRRTAAPSGTSSPGSGSWWTGSCLPGCYTSFRRQHLLPPGENPATRATSQLNANKI